MNKVEKPFGTDLFERDDSSCLKLEDGDIKVLGYLTLLSLANKYCRTNPRKLSQEIGLISADLIESEFARMDKRNLIARKQFLESELQNLERLKQLDYYEEHFIEHGLSYASKIGADSETFLSLGVPYCTLEAAKIL